MRFLFLLLITGCCSPQIKLIHKPLTIPPNCLFDKFTDSEVDSMTEKVGRKIYTNQVSCNIRQDRINAIIQAHNTAHGDK